jgi:hypothetical protein
MQNPGPWPALSLGCGGILDLIFLAAGAFFLYFVLPPLRGWVLRLFGPHNPPITTRWDYIKMMEAKGFHFRRKDRKP